MFLKSIKFIEKEVSRTSNYPCENDWHQLFDETQVSKGNVFYDNK